MISISRHARLTINSCAFTGLDMQLKFITFLLALFLVGCSEEKIETHESLIKLSNEVTKIEITRASQIALKTRRPADIAQAFIIGSAFLLGKSDTSEAQCISKAVGLSGGPAAIIEAASKAFVVGSSAFDISKSQGRQFKSLDKLYDETVNGTPNPTWLDEYQVEKDIILKAINDMYDDNGEHVLSDWLVCTKD